MRTWLLAFLLVAPALAGCAGDAPAPGDGSGDQLATSWTVVDTGGTSHTAASTQGAPVLAFFMATWCSSCRAMTDDVAAVHEEYAAQGLQVLSITWDPKEDHGDLEAWKAQYDQPWPHGIDDQFRIHRLYDIRSQSSVIVLDGNGTLVQHWGYGQADAPAMSQAVEQALASA